jgi:hypothetical protein
MTADLLGIKFDTEVSSEECEELFHKINFVKERTEEMKNSYSYVWFSSKNDEIVLQYIKGVIL